MNRLPIFHDEKNFRDRTEQMFRDMQLQMDQDFMRGFGRPLRSGSAVGSWGAPPPFNRFDNDFFQLHPAHVPQPPPSFPPSQLDQPFPAPAMEILDSKTVDNLFLEDPENKSRIFQMSFDVKDFDPKAVQVRVEDSCLVVEAKQGEIKDGGTKVSREFCRKIQLPPEVDPEKLTSTLSTDGVLSVKAPVPPRYNAVQGAPPPSATSGPASNNNVQTFTTTFKAPPSNHHHQQQQQQQSQSLPRQPMTATATPTVHHSADFPQFQSGFGSGPGSLPGLGQGQSQGQGQGQGQGFYSVPVLAADAASLGVRDRPVFSPLGEGGNGRFRMDLLLDVGRQYSADNVVVRFDERSCLLTVEATREDRDPGTGKSSRSQLSRQFELRERVDPSTMQAVMKSDGLLHVTALTSLS